MEKKTIDKILNKDSYGLTWYEHAQPYLGSHKGMRFRIARDPMDDVSLVSPEEKGEAEFEVIIWPEPFCFEVTPDEQKTSHKFPFTLEGKEQMVAWLNEQYEARFEEWDAVRGKY